MKKTGFIIQLFLLLLASCSGRGGQSAAEGNAASSGEIQLSGAFALYPMAVRWAEEFQKLHPGIRIDISGGGAGKGITDALAGVVDIGMVSREVHAEEVNKGAFAIAVVKDAVVPTINAANPELAAIVRTGLKQAVAKRLWNGEIATWGEVLGTTSRLPVHVFTRSDACGAAETFAAWLGGRQENLKATAVFGDPGLAAAVQKDRVSIGYNNIAYAYDQKTKQPFEGLCIFPLDVNGNGVVDAGEDFYRSTETLIDAINRGSYPSPPARDLYLVTRGKPQKPEVIAFIRYVLTDGQRFANETGYIRLSDDKLQEGLNRL
jgi:phosphate transport system substrate-binding protein